MLKIRFIPLRSVHTKRQVAATRWGDTSQRQIASCVLENFEKMFVAATEFCRRNKSHRFSLIWFFATYCSDKVLSRRQRFSQKFSSTHEAICRCDVSPHLVAATSHPTCVQMGWSVAATCCCNLSPGLVCTDLNTRKSCKFCLPFCRNRIKQFSVSIIKDLNFIKP